MSIESKLDKLTAAVEALTGVLANAALGAPAPEKTQKGPADVAVSDATKIETVVGTTTSAYPDAANCSVDEIRARLRPIVEKHGAAPIEAALKTLGVDMLTSLAAEQYPALLDGVANAINAEV